MQRTSIITAGIATMLLAAPALAATPDLKLINAINVGGSGGWDYASFDPVSHRVLLSHNSSIAAVNVDTGTVTAHLADANGSHIALATGDGKALLITNGKADDVTVNDATTGAVLRTLATDHGPDGAIIDTATGRAFVMANHGGYIDVIDPGLTTVVAHIPAGGAPEAAASDGEGLVFTHLEDKNALVVIDANTMTVKTTYAMPDCDEPSGLAFIAGKRLLLSACHNGVARVTDADTGAEVATLPIGQKPDFALYDTGRQLGYIPCGDGTLTVIDFSGDAPIVAEVVATKTGARTATLDPATGRIYLPTADYGAPEKPGDRPPVIDGTFELLVVGP